MKLCIEPGCIKKALKKLNRCGHHHNKRYRDKAPIRYIFMNLKGNAKKRGKIFRITLEEFTDFIIKNPLYMQLKGRFKDCLQIDRIHNIGGMGPYEISNLQIITKQQNQDKLVEEYQETLDTYVSMTEDDLPF